MHHCSTAQQRVEWISQMIASPSEMDWEVGLSRRHQVSRQTLYRWKAKGEQAFQMKAPGTLLFFHPMFGDPKLQGGPALRKRYPKNKL